MLYFTAAVPAYALSSILHNTMSLYRHQLENLLSVRLSPYSIKHTQSNKPCQTIAHYITKFNALK